MEAGKLKWKISIYREVATTSTDGSTKFKYVLQRTARAHMLFGRGWKSVIQDEMVYQRSYYFTLRSYIDVKDTDIIKYKGSLYRIIAIEEKEDKMSNVLTCEEIVDSESIELVDSL